MSQGGEWSGRQQETAGAQTATTMIKSVIRDFIKYSQTMNFKAMEVFENR